MTRAGLRAPRLGAAAAAAVSPSLATATPAPHARGAASFRSGAASCASRKSSRSSSRRRLTSPSRTSSPERSSRRSTSARVGEQDRKETRQQRAREKERRRSRPRRNSQTRRGSCAPRVPPTARSSLCTCTSPQARSGSRWGRDGSRGAKKEEAWAGLRIWCWRGRTAMGKSRRRGDVCCKMRGFKAAARAVAPAGKDRQLPSTNGRLYCSSEASLT
mmetsp:Transcript_17803/g.58246  ORF Transcript_17803/g.58246 Transcript_17803/m.58246 type:complete len:217 (-) Transcript_17803:722-1372(-)